MKNDDLRKIHAHGPELWKQVAAQSPEVLMAFSCGKDSIAAWLALREWGGFRRIMPYHMFLIPGLEFVDDGLKYAEDFFGERIIQVPHPSLYRMLAHAVFQPPERIPILAAAGLPEFDYRVIVDMLIDKHNLPAGSLMVNGVRCCDSIYRRLALQRAGPIRNGACNVIWDWNKARTMERIRAAGYKLPVDYEMFGRSFDGIDYRFLRPIKDRFPRDYARILDLFPLAELELFRRGER